MIMAITMVVYDDDDDYDDDFARYSNYCDICVYTQC